MAATHSSSTSHRREGVEEDEGVSNLDADAVLGDTVADAEGVEAVASTEAADDRLRQDGEETRVLVSAPKDEDDGDKEDEVELKDEDENVVMYEVQMKVEVPEEVQVEEEILVKNDIRNQHESDLSIRDEDGSGDDDEVDKEGEQDDEFVAEGGSEMPSTRPSISLSDISSVPVEVTLRSACPLCPEGQPDDESLGLTGNAACTFPAGEKTSRRRLRRRNATGAYNIVIRAVTATEYTFPILEQARKFPIEAETDIATIKVNGTSGRFAGHRSRRVDHKDGEWRRLNRKVRLMVHI